MLRIIVRNQHFGAVVHMEGAIAETSLKTFDVELPEIEKYLKVAEKWTSREVIGIEILGD